MTRLPDISNQKINNAGAMALAKGDEMSEIKSIDGMSDLSKEVAKLSKILTDHIEKFACAFAKKTGLDPTKIKMVQQSLDNGFGYKVWFEPFPSDSEIEMYRAGQERALAELAARDALIERLIEVGELFSGGFEHGAFGVLANGNGFGGYDEGTVRGMEFLEKIQSRLHAIVVEYRASKDGGE